MLNFTAIIEKEEDMYIAQCPEIGTVSQGTTIDEAVANLTEATKLYLEEFPVKNTNKSLLTTFQVAAWGINAPILRKVSGEKAIKILCNKLGFTLSGRSGSHVRLSKETKEGKVGTVVPLHKELKIGTLKGILRLAKIEEEEFSRYL